MSLSFRPSEARDADAIGTLAAEFHAYLRAIGDQAQFHWSSAQYLRDGFGEDPAFEGIVAEAGAAVVGYALYHFGYDTNAGRRYLYLIDLYVSQAFRRGGIGTALMERVSAAARTRRAEFVTWSVHKENAAAVRFYERIGGRYEPDTHIMWRPAAPHPEPAGATAD
jgi:ribosomal protein S18 acetylase RimI-like enzyme